MKKLILVFTLSSLAQASTIDCQKLVETWVSQSESSGRWVLESVFVDHVKNFTRPLHEKNDNIRMPFYTQAEKVSFIPLTQNNHYYLKLNENLNLGSAGLWSSLEIPRSYIETMNGDTSVCHIMTKNTIQFHGEKESSDLTESRYYQLQVQVIASKKESEISIPDIAINEIDRCAYEKNCL
jgi:hypothetical protein